MYDLKIVCPITVGRASELAILNKAIDQAQAGNGQVFLISGEAGVGKSRLVAAAQAYAAGNEVAVFQGHCYQEDLSTPYAPLIDLLHPFFSGHAATPFPADIEPVARELLRLLPDIAPVIVETPLVLTLDPERKKRRLFAFLSQLLTMQAADKPLLVVIEDVHWSDDSSLEFLAGIERVDGHGAAQYVDVAVALRQPFGKRLPLVAAGPAAVHAQFAFGWIVF
jgi:predicted ATPase